VYDSSLRGLVLKHKRIWLLLFLTATLLLFRMLDLEEQIHFISWTAAGIRTTITSGHLAIEKVIAQDAATGKPTPAFAVGLKPGDLILAMHDSSGQGGAVRGRMDAGWVLREVSNEQPWTIMVERGGGPAPVETLRLAMPPIPHQSVPWKFLAIRIAARDLVTLIAIATALMIGLAKPDDPNALVASLLLLGFSSLFGSSFRPALRDLWILVRSAGLCFTPYLILRFFLMFPSPSPLERKVPRLKQALLVFATAAFVFEAVTTWRFEESFSPLTLMGANFVEPVVSNALWLMLALALLSLLLNIVQSRSRDERRRLGILLTGVAGLIPLAVMLTVGELRLPVWFWVLAVAGAALFPMSFFYVVVKHRVFGIKVFLRRGLQYAFVSRGFRAVQASVIFVALFFFSTWFFNHVVTHVTLPGLMLYVLLVVFAVSMLIRRLNRRVMQAIDRRFFRDAYNAQHVLRNLSRAVRQLATEPNRLVDTVADQVSSALHADQVAIFLLGAQLRPAPAAAEGAANMRLVLSGAPDYRCCALRRVSRQPSAALATATDSESLVLPKGAFISQYLGAFADAEPDAVEVYLDDPKSWANALARTDSRSGGLYHERLLLEQLNTRLIVPLATSEGVTGFFSLGEKLSEEPYSREDKELLQNVAGQTAIALENARLFGQVAEQQKLQRELEIAQTVQQQLFPQTLPPLATIEYTGVCQPARGVGGDYYDFLSIATERLGFALGDISGKGIAAALLMASLQALLRSHAPLHGQDVSGLISDVNRLLFGSTDSSKYATFFYGLYDDRTRSLTYVNAGHNPPMLFRPLSSGAPDGGAAGGAEVLRLEASGTVIGLLANASYEQASVGLRPGDVLLIYTDGISEAMNSRDEEFGEDRLQGLVSANLQLSAVQLQKLILAEIERFVAGAPQHDDMTLVVAKVG
jgi:sigma-B regulation protein RsbU (phosphoserine phosphatase)